jgi:hypothetical protein
LPLAELGALNAKPTNEKLLSKQTTACVVSPKAMHEILKDMAKGILAQSGMIYLALP